MKRLYKLLSRLLGRNLATTPKEVILDQLQEPRALPMSVPEFEEWSNRIISGALVKALPESQKFTLASLLMHLGPTESHKPDAFFIHSLRKLAVNQVAHAMMENIRNEAKKRLAEQEQSPTKLAIAKEYDANTTGVAGVLED